MATRVNRTNLLIFLMIVTALLFSGCSNSNKLVLSGSIESTQIDANSETVGRIIKLDKDEGDLVKKGDILAIIDSSSQELILKQYEAAVKGKQARLDELRAGTRTEQIKQAEASVSTAGTAVNSANTAVDNAQINYDYWFDKYNKIKSLNESGAASETDVQDARYKADSAKQQLITAQKQLTSTQSQLQSVQAQLELLRNGNTNQTIKAAEADLEQSQAALEQAKLALSKHQVKSPVDGTYLLRNVDLDDIVNPGTGIATISDLSDLWVKVYIPQRDLGSIKLGQELTLKTASVEGIIKGKITYIASEAEFTPKNTETSKAKENTVFKVKIKILDNLDKLKPGMTVDVDIPLK